MVIGYKHQVNCFESALVEIAIIEYISSCCIHDPKKLNSIEGITSHLIEVLLPFDINNYQFATDDEYIYSINGTIRFWISLQGSSYPKEITKFIFEKLNQSIKKIK